MVTICIHHLSSNPASVAGNRGVYHSTDSHVTVWCMAEPTILNVAASRAESAGRFSAVGGSFVIHEWRGSGPAALHVHRADDEAWHVLDGTLRFRFVDRVVDVGPGGTVFVPAGVAHAYEAFGARYLIVLTPRLAALIGELQQSSDGSQHSAVYEKYESELLER
jgi:mannose-6-phosphate isomerase-like protein (cupin superfamily)